MIKYLFLHTSLTVIVFMVWIESTHLSGGEVGMAPFVLLIFVGYQLAIGVVLSIIFRKMLLHRTSMIIGLCVYLVIYELIPILLGNELLISGIFKAGSDGEINRAFSLTPIAAGAITIVTILLREKNKSKQ